MKSTSLKRFSILGVVLVAASAVTAAVLPATQKDDEKTGTGKVVDTTSPAFPDEKTCIAGGSACDYLSATNSSNNVIHDDASDVDSTSLNTTTR